LTAIPAAELAAAQTHPKRRRNPVRTSIRTKRQGDFMQSQSPATHFQPARAWFMTAMLFLLMVINFIDKVALGLVAAPLMKELGLSPAQYGMLAGSFFLLFAITGVAGGFLANRWPTRWILLAMALVWSVVQLPVALSSSLAMLLACRILLGAGEGPAQPIAIHACYKWFPDARRNLPVTVFQQGGVLGMVAAGILIPVINDTWGWRSNFVMLAVMGFAWGVLWLCFGREGTLEVNTSTSARKYAHAAPDGARRLPYRALLTNRTFVCTTALHFCAFLSLALVLTWLPAYLNQGLGYSSRVAGQMFAGALLVSTPVGLGLSAWSQRMMVRGVASRLARGAFVCGCLLVGGVLFVVAAAFGLAPSVKVALIAVAIAMTPIIYSLGPAMVAQITPAPQRGAMLAIEYSVAWIAGIIAPPIVGWLIRNAGNDIARGFEHGLILTGVLLVMLSLVGLRMLDPEASAARLSSLASGDAPHGPASPAEPAPTSP
jgi:MFS family permease